MQECRQPTIDVLLLLSCDSLLEADRDFCFDLSLRLLAPGSIVGTSGQSSGSRLRLPRAEEGVWRRVRRSSVSPAAASWINWRARGRLK